MSKTQTPTMPSWYTERQQATALAQLRAEQAQLPTNGNGNGQQPAPSTTAPAKTPVARP